MDSQGGAGMWQSMVVKSTDKKPNRITRQIINDALRARGRDESLREGDGYFYFGGGDAVNWLSSTVMVKKLSDLTLDQWMKEFDKLLENDRKIRKGAIRGQKKKPKR